MSTEEDDEREAQIGAPLDAEDAARWDAAEEGAEMLRDGDVHGAITELEVVLRTDPDNPYAYHFLGAAHFEAAAWEKALKAYLSALERAPHYLGALVGAGQTLRMLGRHREALRVGKQILARDKNDPDGLYLMGLVHYTRGEEAAAQSYLSRFLATGPEVEVAQEARGLLEILAGRVQPLPPEDGGTGEPN